MEGTDFKYGNVRIRISVSLSRQHSGSKRQPQHFESVMTLEN